MITQEKKTRMTQTKTTIYLLDADCVALTELKAHYGLTTLSDVIRLALRTLALPSPASLSTKRRSFPLSSATVQQGEYVGLSEQLQRTLDLLTRTEKELLLTRQALQHVAAGLRPVHQKRP